MGATKKEKCFQELFTTNYSRLYYAALYMLNDSETAKDMVDDVFTELWENFGADSEMYTSSYLLKSVHNRCIDYLRHIEVKNRYAQLYLKLNSEGLLAEDDEKDERLEVIYKVMEQMPLRTRFVMDQCYFENKKYAEVAEILGISTDGVRKHVMKALAMLRNEFSVNYKKGYYPKKNNNR
ncbi:MAG: sigma-70 family RNA polymerase sigma factor [Bacteroidales bacterium]|nr:sigma-70 family RNA polymerase sigma factor [Bacteroidales bacterium]